MVGMERMNSTSLWIRMSVKPPKYPDSPPNKTPRMRLIITPTSPMDIDILVPYITRDHMSLPMRSVPMRWKFRIPCSPSTPIKWMLVLNCLHSLYSYPRTKKRIRCFLVLSVVYSSRRLTGFRVTLRSYTYGNEGVSPSNMCTLWGPTKTLWESTLSGSWIAKNSGKRTTK